jgi:superfamily II DNA or RNA helicase
VILSSLPIQEGGDLRLESEAQSFDLAFQDVPILETPVGLIHLTSDIRNTSIFLDAEDTRSKGVLHPGDIVGRCLTRSAVQSLPVGDPSTELDEKDPFRRILEALYPVTEAPVELIKVSPFIGEWTPRLYQQEAISAFLDTRSLLLADDLGTGKSISAIAALSELIQQRKAKRALVVCLGYMMRHWEHQFSIWAPELDVHSVRDMLDHLSKAWTETEQVVLVDYRHIGAGFKQGSFSKAQLEFDVLILDDAMVALQRAELWVAQLNTVNATMRWGLSGSVPRSTQEWIMLFTLLIPRKVEEELKKHQSDPRERYLPFVMKRQKADIADEMPLWNRQEIWLDLDRNQQAAYQDALTEEQDRLMQMGTSITRDHIAETLQRLSDVCNLSGSQFGGPKIYALVDHVREITSSGDKVVVFNQERGENLGHLETALDSFGVRVLEAEGNQEMCAEALDAMRNDDSVRVLLAHPEAKTDGWPITGASYIIHFDRGFDVAANWRGERAFFPEVEPSIPVNVYEFWIARTHEERLHALLMSRFPGEVSDPSMRLLPEWHPELTIDDWLTGVLHVGSQKEQALI